MSTPKPQNEPTMEEILASIRKIISEDAETPAKPGESPAAAAPAAPAAAPAAPSAPTAPASPTAAGDESVLELTDMVKDDGSVEKVKQSSEELVMTDTTPEPVAAPPRPAAGDNELLSSRSAAAAASALAGLAGAAAASRGMALGNGQKTIEDIVRELLRPMLKDWLDANLPPLVERLVQREIAKLAGHVDDR
jgi:uncharacterized protein